MIRPPIGYVLTQHPRTTQTFINAEIDALRSRGHEVVVFSLNEPTPGAQRNPFIAEEVERTVYLKQGGPRAVIGPLFACARIRPSALVAVALLALRSGGYDVRRVLWRLFHLAEALIVWDHCRARGVRTVHAHFGQTTSTVGWLATRLGHLSGAGPTDLVVTVHCGTEVEDVNETIPALKARDARAIVAISDHTRSQLMRHVSREHWEKITVIRCGVDLDFFEMQPLREADPPKILFVGRLDPVKGVSVLLAGARLLVERGVRFELDIVGGGSIEEQLRDEAADLAQVTFLGEQQPAEVRSALARAQVFCLPSFDEGIPVSIMEAMAVGTPVVATAVAGVPELAIDGDTALVVPAGNEVALADALERILTDRSLARSLARSARERVEDRHDASRNLLALMDLLEG